MNATILATDLDGTFLPLNGDTVHFQALNKIWERRHNNSQLQLFFVTGRNFNSVETAIKDFALPAPDKIIADGGATIYEYINNQWLINGTYEAHLKSLAEHIDTEEVIAALTDITELTLQEPENQSECKISYYAPADTLVSMAATVTDILNHLSLSIAYSFDPSSGKGQIDILPEGISKAYALLWLWQVGLLDKSRLIYAGNGISDLPVFESGIKSIIVENTPGEIKAKLLKEQSRDTIYFSLLPSTVGVVEGCRYYGWK